MDNMDIDCKVQKENIYFKLFQSGTNELFVREIKNYFSTSDMGKQGAERLKKIIYSEDL